MNIRVAEILLLGNLALVGCNLDLGMSEDTSGQAPQAVNDAVTTAEDTPVTIAVLANDTDSGGRTLTVKAISQPAHGQAVINPDQTVTYTPTTNFNGTDSFAYTLSNGESESGAEVTITLTAVDDPPTIMSIANQTINEGTTTGPVPFTIGDVDNPITALTVTATSNNPALIPNTNLVLAGSGASRTITATPLPNASGSSAVITVSVSDGVATASTTFTVVVKPVPDVAIVTGATTGNVVEDTTLTTSGKLDVNDPDAGEAGFQVRNNTPGTYGSFSIGPSGAWTYTLNNNSPDVQALREGEKRTDTFQVLTIDGTPTTVTLTITGRNDAPAIGSQLVTNGSFEQPIVSPGTYIYSNSVPGWTRDAADERVLGSGIEIQNHVAGSPYQDDQFVELDSDGRTAIYQDLATTPGASYVLSFAFSPRPSIAENRMTVSWGGSPVATLLADGTNNRDTVWTVYTYTLTATDTITRLKFDNLTEISDAYGDYVDAVSVTAVPDWSGTPLVPNQTIPVNSTTGSIPFTVKDVETAADALTVTAISDNQGLIPDANLVLGSSGANRTITVTPVTNQSGVATVTVRVSDGTGTTTKSFMVNAVAPLPRTGQTTCYDQNGTRIDCAGTGQDGDKQAGVAWPTPRFVDNNDGTVTDRLTGLVWLKDANCFGAVVWQTALDDANNLANGKCVLKDGSTVGQWRLSNRREQFSLGDFQQYNPALPVGYPFANVQIVGYYWSSVSDAAQPANAWSTRFYSISVSTHNKTQIQTDYVWPVRDGLPGTAPAPVPRTGQTTCYDQYGTQTGCANTGQDGDKQAGVAWPTPRFVDNGNGTVTDQLTALIWLKNANRFGAVDWQTALNKANSLENGQYDLKDGSAVGQWRLPNARELESLIDYEYSNPALSNTEGTGQWTEGKVFTGVQSAHYWSSTSQEENPANAWLVDFSRTGTVPIINKINGTNYVWPVRGGQ